MLHVWNQYLSDVSYHKQRQHRHSFNSHVDVLHTKQQDNIRRDLEQSSNTLQCFITLFLSVFKYIALVTIFFYNIIVYLRIHKIPWSSQHDSTENKQRYWIIHSLKARSLLYFFLFLSALRKGHISNPWSSFCMSRCSFICWVTLLHSSINSSKIWLKIFDSYPDYSAVWE